MTVGADEGEIAETGSPILVAADPIDRRAPLLWTSTILAIAVVILAATGAPALTEWVDAMPEGWLTERIHPAAVEWDRRTRRFAGPSRWVAERWKSAHDLRFGREQPGEPGASDLP